MPRKGFEIALAKMSTIFYIGVDKSAWNVEMVGRCKVGKGVEWEGLGCCVIMLRQSNRCFLAFLSCLVVEM